MPANVVSPHKSSIGSLDANVMALIAYLASAVLGFIPGVGYVAWLAPLVIFFLEKESSFVKFHAMQSFVLNAISAIFSILITVVIGGITSAAVASAVTGNVGAAGAVLGASALVTTVTLIVGLVFTVLAIIALIQAYQYKEYKIPIVGGIAEKVAGLFGGIAPK